MTQDTSISTLINLTPLTAVASLGEKQISSLFGANSNADSTSQLSRISSLRQLSFPTLPVQKGNLLRINNDCSAKQQLLARLFPAATIARQLSSLPTSQPSWNHPPAQLVWKHELGGALCRADLPLMSQNENENVGTNRPLSVSAWYILHRTFL